MSVSPNGFRRPHASLGTLVVLHGVFIRSFEVRHSACKFLLCQGPSEPQCGRTPPLPVLKLPTRGSQPTVLVWFNLQVAPWGRMAPQQSKDSEHHTRAAYIDSARELQWSIGSYVAKHGCSHGQPMRARFVAGHFKLDLPSV